MMKRRDVTAAENVDFISLNLMQTNNSVDCNIALIKCSLSFVVFKSVKGRFLNGEYGLWSF